MRPKNTFNALYKLVQELNRISGHLYFVVMDASIITLHDVTCNKMLFPEKPDDIEKFLMQLSSLKEAWRHHNFMKISKNPNYVNMTLVAKIQKIYGII